MPESLFVRLGGEDAIMAAVELFYQKVLEDELTAPFFENLDMPRQIRKQIAFMGMAFGAPSEYTGRDLRTAHAALVERGLGDEHFDAIARHLDSTLRELNIPDELITETLAIVEGTRNEVLNR